MAMTRSVGTIQRVFLLALMILSSVAVAEDSDPHWFDGRRKVKLWRLEYSGEYRWGEPLALRSLIEAALSDGTTNGRDGKGIVYVLSAGNGSTDFSGVPTERFFELKNGPYVRA